MRTSKRPLYLKILCVLCAVLFALSSFAAVLSGLVRLFLDPERIVAQVVTESYRAQIIESVKTKLQQESPYYGIPEEVLYKGLQQELIDQKASDSVRYAVNAVLGGEHRTETYPAEPFYAALEEYFDTLRAQGEEFELNEEALTQISDECAGLTEAYLNPIPASIARLVFQNPRILTISKVCVAVKRGFFVCLIAAAISLVCLVLLSPKDFKEKLFWVAAPAFCASSLLFVPAVFVFTGNGLAGLVLDESITRSFLEGFYSLVRGVFLWGSAIWFAISAILLCVSIVLKSRPDQSKSTD